MAAEYSTADIGKLSLRNGLIISAINIVLNIAIYIVDPVMMFANLWIPILDFVAIIVLLVVFGLEVRKRIGGYWMFKDSFKSLFIMTVLLAVTATLYSFILFKFINPELPQLANRAMESSMVSRLNNANVPQDQVAKYTKPFEDGEVEAKMQPTFQNEFKSLGGSIVLYVIVSLIIGAIIIKKKPAYLDDNIEYTDPRATN